MDIRPGYKLVKASVAFYQGVVAGAIVEIPTEIADQAIDAGAAEAVDTLTARLRALPTAQGVRRFIDDDSPSGGPVVLAEVGRPADDADHPAWFEYAVSRGADPAEAERLTRDELLYLYGGDEGGVEAEAEVPEVEGLPTGDPIPTVEEVTPAENADDDSATPSGGEAEATVAE